jgi:hypothetical protein
VVSISARKTEVGAVEEVPLGENSSEVDSMDRVGDGFEVVGR